MKFLLPRLVLFCLMSFAGMTMVLADPPQNRAEGRGRAERSSNASEQERSRNAQEVRDQQDENGRKPSRLSPEERKALRQQINEAGQDLYQRKR